MGTYMGAYSSEGNVRYDVKSQAIRITVKQAVFIYRYYYNNEWISVWELMDKNGFSHECETEINYKQEDLLGKRIGIIEKQLIVL